MKDAPDRPARRAPIFALLGSSAVSELGNVLTYVAVPWFVLETTESAARTGLTGGATTLAAVLAGLLGGPVVDRLGFKRTSVAADLASGVTVAAIPLLYHTIGLAFWQLLVLVFLGAFLDAPGLTARQGLVPELSAMAGMRRERANSALQGIESASVLLGPPLAGVLIAALTPSNVLWIDAATFAVSAAAVAGLVPAAVRRAVPSEEEARGVRRYLADLSEGLAFVRRDRVILSIMTIAVVANFLVTPLLSVVLPVYARQVYGGAAQLGLMLGGFGAGALVGTLLFGAVGHRLPRRATLVGCLVVLGLPFWVLVAEPPLPFSVGALALTGLAIGPPNPLIFTVEQERVPREMLGRVIGADQALSMAAAPLGMVLAGFVVEIAGLRTTLAGISSCWLFVGVISLLNPHLRSMDDTKAVDES